MYRLLIVDDEEIITDTLYDVFSRLMPEQLDVCKAYSGKEALAWMSRTRIDIILTDIAMPGLSGLALIEKIQELWPRCKVIFLTGHHNFEYIYQAIQLNDVRYLLKTEGYDKVTETVKEVVTELRKMSLNGLQIEQTEEEKHAYELIAQSDFIRDVLYKSKMICHNPTGLLTEFNKLNLPLDPTKHVYLVLGRLDYPKGKSYTERQQMLGFVRANWNRHLSKHINNMGIVDRYGDMVWFIQPAQHNKLPHPHLVEYLEGTLEVHQEECLDKIGLTLQLTISREIEDWGVVSQKYEHLRQLQQLKMIDGYPCIIKEKECNNESKKVDLPSNQKIDILTAHLAANRMDDFFEVFSDLIRSTQSGNYDEMIGIYYTIAVLLYSYISQNDLHDRINNFEKLLKMDEHNSVKSSFQYLKQVATQIFKFKQTDDRNRATKVIDRICQYIENHLEEDLSLVRLAEIHYFNPSYLSYFFKQEQGINLSEYIDRCRIRKAKELLQNGDLKVREVSEHVGYNAAHSFTRFFKKMTGLTPKEYRENLTKSAK
ncbi:response regulator transcription factor [Amphibacillus jilinensis]|uniref:response regulator transcription factor n=1 Tax=Amphibacillus jilinensis TaxID=1216008 RepID=UPI0002EA88FA|nr:response regulator [Amphibacillus jilinensis]